MERGRFFTKPPCGSNLHRREEHGNTFAHEIEHIIGSKEAFRIEEEEIIRYGQ